MLISNITSSNLKLVWSKVTYSTISPEVYSKTKGYSKSIQMLELSIALLLS